MKIKSLLIAALMLLATLSNAQDLAGRKIINGNLGMTLLFGNGNSTIGLNADLLYGKIKPNLTYMAFGGTVQSIPSGTDINGKTINLTSVGPSIQKGKFIKILDKLYLAPYIGGNASIVFVADEIGGKISAEAVPIRFMYHFTDKFMLSASFGSASFNAQHVSQITAINLSGSLSNNSGFGVFYTFK
jgi:hypothetical protein